jgi:hypothetical protein
MTNRLLLPRYSYLHGMSKHQMESLADDSHTSKLVDFGKFRVESAIKEGYLAKSHLQDIESQLSLIGLKASQIWRSQA